MVDISKDLEEVAKKLAEVRQGLNKVLARIENMQGYLAKYTKGIE